MKLYRVTMAVTVDVWSNDPGGAVELVLTNLSKAVSQTAFHVDGHLVGNPFMNARVVSGTVREWREPVEPVQEAK